MTWKTSTEVAQVEQKPDQEIRERRKKKRLALRILRRCATMPLYAMDKRAIMGNCTETPFLNFNLLVQNMQQHVSFTNDGVTTTSLYANRTKKGSDKG